MGPGREPALKQMARGIAALAVLAVVVAVLFVGSALTAPILGVGSFAVWGAVGGAATWLWLSRRRWATADAVFASSRSPSPQPSP
jgi:hypothetical protein